MSNSEFVEWLRKNNDEADFLWQQILTVKKELIVKTKKLSSMIDFSEYEKQKIKNTQWIWDAFHYGEKVIMIDLVHDNEIGGLKVYLDTCIRPSGYQFRISERNQKIKELRNFLLKKHIDLPEDQYLHFEKALPYDADLEIVRDRLQGILDKIIQ